MDCPLVSVVLPIYNVERFLDRCICSVVNQTYKALEIILVDDGSPDNCPEICDEWAKRDSRIKVVHKKNAGLGYARNTGIAHATGEYICFFDSDDYIELNTVDTCVKAAILEEADIVCFGNDVLSQKGDLLSVRIPKPSQSTYADEEIRNIAMPNVLSYSAATGEDWNFSMSAWSAMYAMRVIRESGWRFVSEREIISEDIYSVLEFYQYVRKMVIVPNVLYHYIANPVSLSRIYREDRYEKVKYLAYRLTELSQKMDCEEILRERIACIFLGLTIGAVKQIVSANMPIAKKKEALFKVLQDGYLQEVLSKNDYSDESFQKRLIFSAMKQKNWFACYVLIKIRNLAGNQRH